MVCRAGQQSMICDGGVCQEFMIHRVNSPRSRDWSSGSVIHGEPPGPNRKTDACENITFPRTSYRAGRYGAPLMWLVKRATAKKNSVILDKHTFHEDFGIGIFGQIVGVDKRWIIRIGGSQTNCSFASWMK